MSAKLLSSILACATLLLAPLQSEAQLPRDPVERARVISQIMETQSRQLTLFDRQGKRLASSDLATSTTSPFFRRTRNEWR